jgi:hypothetical protein
MEQTSAQEKQVGVTQTEIREIKTEVKGLSKMVHEVHAALIGSEMTKDGGLVGRIIESEKQLFILSERVVEVEKMNAKAEMYLKVIYALSGSGATAIVISLVKHFLMNK